MTINEIKLKRDVLQLTITQLIKDFEKETDCEVSNIELLTQGNENETLSGRRIFIGTQVTVLVRKY